MKMTRTGSMLATAAALLLTACAAPKLETHDAFGRLAARLEHEVVASYPFVPIALRATALPDQLIDTLLKRGDFQYRNITRLKVEAVRDVDIRSLRHTAVLLNTNLGRMFVLLRYEDGLDGWYFRIYEAT
jgi:hypothetical protein